MGKFVEILAMTLGGISLFAVCFLGFAITSGKTLEEVPVLGSLVASDAPDEGEAVEKTPAERIPNSTRPKTDIIEHTSGVLQSFSVPSPFSQAELKELADELKDTRAKYERRLEEVEGESKEIALRNEGLDDREERLLEFQDELKKLDDE